MPRTLRRRASSSASSWSSGGRIPGSRVASIVLPDPRGAGQQQAVPAGRCDDQRANRLRLPAHVRELRPPGVSGGSGGGAAGASGCSPREQLRGGAEVPHRRDAQLPGQRRLGCGFPRDGERLHAAGAARSPPQRTCRAPEHRAVQAELAEQRDAPEPLAGTDRRRQGRRMRSRARGPARRRAAAPDARRRRSGARAIAGRSCEPRSGSARAPSMEARRASRRPGRPFRTSASTETWRTSPPSIAKVCATASMRAHATAEVRWDPRGARRAWRIPERGGYAVSWSTRSASIQRSRPEPRPRPTPFRGSPLQPDDSGGVSRRNFGLQPCGYSPAGCRATYPAVEVIASVQRFPVSASATVSKRLPSTTMNACSAFA